MKKVFSGECFKVEVSREKYELAGKEYEHGVCALFVEDDGNWFKKVVFDAAWLHEIIRILQEAERSGAKRPKTSLRV